MDFAPGVHFGLPEADYHAAPALSNSGIRWLQVSPLDFWSRSWMNEKYEHETTIFMDVGSAYHARLVEGRETFYARYAPKLDPADYPDALQTAAQIKNELRVHGAKLGGDKAELAARLLEINPSAQIWDEMWREYASDVHPGKTMLPAELIGKIEYSAAMVEKHPELSKAFFGGMPEVSIFWNDEETGVPMKSRLDYLKPRAIVDLKTFGNQHGRSIDRAVATAVANYRLHIQVAVYTEAVKQAQEHIRAGRVEGDVDPAYLDALAASQDFKFLFVFQQTGIAPVALGKVFERGTTYDIGRITMRDAIAKFAECMEAFGTDVPWVDVRPITTFDDTEFPAYLGEA